jgi:hypothetical protein
MAILTPDSGSILVNRMFAIEELDSQPDRVRVFVLEMVGAVIVVLQANARELRRLPDEERRDSVAVVAERVVSPPVEAENALAASAGVLIP